MRGTKITTFLKNPFCKKKSYQNKFIFLLTITFINIIINSIVLLLLDSNNIESDNVISKLNIIEQFIFIGILFPIVEELIFRYPLKLSRNNIDMIFYLTIPISIILLFSSNLITLVILILTFILLYISFKEKIKDNINKTPTNIFVFYGLAFLFSICHINNYSSDPIHYIIIFFVLAFISGILFSVIRMLIGFKYAVWSHIIYNSFFIILNFLYPI
ncbi:hypothetical protein [Polaribacter sp. Z022]|uniref:hypothetical protein n=1 Tax=Polaribacter sp. Z022 TaxID=2927125 RepID=UPI0020219E33|nr:hypothetical protein [Polaribacter sp. Z022]MCL7755113.1 hypothetical protein [Polaribacter sp. Z022]